MAALFDRPMRIARLCGLAWLCMAIALTGLGFSPNEYLIQVRGFTGPQPYPAVRVAVEAGLLGLALLGLARALAKTRWPRVRAMSGVFLGSGVVSAMALMGAMHQAPHHGWFALLMASLALIAFVFLLIFSASAWSKLPVDGD